MSVRRHTGWLLDLYAVPQHGLTIWLLDEHSGERLQLKQDFPITFYAAGPSGRLRALWRFLQAQPVQVDLQREQRRDLFQPRPVDVLSMRVAQPAAQPRLFRHLVGQFPELDYYDADLPLTLRHAAAHGTFPLARCCVTAGADGQVAGIEVLDSPWDMDPVDPPLRILSIEPDVDPSHGPPEQLVIRTERGVTQRLALRAARPLLVNLRALLQRCDPDLLFTK